MIIIKWKSVPAFSPNPNPILHLEYESIEDVMGIDGYFIKTAWVVTAEGSEILKNKLSKKLKADQQLKKLKQYERLKRELNIE